MQGQTSVAGEGKHDLDPTRQPFGVHRGPQRSIERRACTTLNSGCCDALRRIVRIGLFVKEITLTGFPARL